MQRYSVAIMILFGPKATNIKAMASILWKAVQFVSACARALHARHMATLIVVAVDKMYQKGKLPSYVRPFRT